MNTTAGRLSRMATSVRVAGGSLPNGKAAAVEGGAS